MHIEFLVEDSSGKTFLNSLIPKIVGDLNVTWRVHGYRGIGKIPNGLGGVADPSKRIILDQLPRLLGGFNRTPYVDAVVVVVDSDSRNCDEFMEELTAICTRIGMSKRVLFKLATEEMEAWYFGDQCAVIAAYPSANKPALKAYVQDSICGTWERLADAITPGGSERVRVQGWPAPGILKAEWADRIPPHMDVDRNVSPSFERLVNGIRGLIT